MKTIDITGKRFGRLVAIKFSHSKGGHYFWECLCDCGNKVVIGKGNIVGGHTKSCGCLRREIIHGMAGTKEYKIWTEMLQRCRNPNNKAYKHYGGRGITVCKKWLKFENFFTDMGKRPEGTWLERRNNDSDYKPSNCGWATPREQHRNTRANKIIKYKGQSKCLAQWCEELNLNYKTTLKRFRMGWLVEKAFTTPVQIQRGKNAPL